MRCGSGAPVYLVNLVNLVNKVQTRTKLCLQRTTRLREQQPNFGRLSPTSTAPSFWTFQRCAHDTCTTNNSQAA